MYSKIIHPITYKQIKVSSSLGNQLLNHYLNRLKGGSSIWQPREVKSEYERQAHQLTKQLSQFFQEKDPSLINKASPYIKEAIDKDQLTVLTQQLKERYQAIPNGWQVYLPLKPRHTIKEPNTSEEHNVEQVSERVRYAMDIGALHASQRQFMDKQRSTLDHITGPVYKDNEKPQLYFLIDCHGSNLDDLIPDSLLKNVKIMTSAEKGCFHVSNPQENQTVWDTLTHPSNKSLLTTLFGSSDGASLFSQQLGVSYNAEAMEKGAYQLSLRLRDIRTDMKFNIGNTPTDKHFGIFELPNPNAGPYLIQDDTQPQFKYRDNNHFTEWAKQLEEIQGFFNLSQVIEYIKQCMTHTHPDITNYEINIIMFACRVTS